MSDRLHSWTFKRQRENQAKQLSILGYKRTIEIEVQIIFQMAGLWIEPSIPVAFSSGRPHVWPCN